MSKIIKVIYFILMLLFIFSFCSNTSNKKYEPYKYYVSDLEKIKIEEAISEEDFDKQEIRIGFAIPFTGGLSSLGKSVFNGALLAIKEINEPQPQDLNKNNDKKNEDDTENIFGKRVKIVVEDTTTDPDIGFMVAEKLAFIDKVHIIIGEYASGVTMKMVAAAKKSNTVQISPLSTSARITDLDDNDTMFRTVPSDNLQAEVIAEVAKEERKYEYVAVLHQDNPYGNGLALSFATSFRDRGGKCDLIPYNENNVEFNQEINQLDLYLKKNKNVSLAVLIIGYPADLEILIKQCQNKNIKTNFFFSDGAQTPDLFQKLDSKYMEGSWGTGFGKFDSPYLDTFVKKYNEEFEEEYIVYAVNMYDATAIAILTLAHASKYYLHGEPIKQSIRITTNRGGEIVHAGELLKGIDLIKEGFDINYVGLGADYEFDNNGDVKNYIYSIWEVKNSQIITLKMKEARKTRKKTTTP